MVYSKRRSGGNVAWDGTMQSALTLRAAIQRTRLLGGTQDMSAGEGVINASSVQVLLRDAEGPMLYASRGGIELLQQLSIGRQMIGTRINFLEQLTDRARPSCSRIRRAMSTR